MRKKQPIETAIETAVRLSHGPSALAYRIGCTPAYICKMVTTGHVPAERARLIEGATGYRVTAEQLNPRVFCRRFVDVNGRRFYLEPYENKG